MTQDITEATVERVAAELDLWNVENDPHGLVVEMITTMRDAAALLRALRARLTEVERERDEARLAADLLRWSQVPWEAPHE
jgi:hypothetical protein